MPGDTCIICGNTRAKDASVSMHRFPQEQMKRERWLRSLGHYLLCFLKEVGTLTPRHSSHQRRAATL